MSPVASQLGWISEVNYVVFLLGEAFFDERCPLSVMGRAGPDFVGVFLRSVKSDLLRRANTLHTRGCCRRLLSEAGCSGIRLSRLEAGNPAYLAALCGHGDCLRVLQRVGCAVDRPASHNGWTPAFTAAAFGHEGCLRALWEAGCDLNIGWDSQTPAFVAAVHGYSRCLRVLREAGCDLERGCALGSPAGIAALNGHKGCLRVLTESPPGRTTARVALASPRAGEATQSVGGGGGAAVPPPTHDHTQVGQSHR